MVWGTFETEEEKHREDVAQMGVVTVIRDRLFNPVLRALAYYTAMTLYTVVQWHPDLLRNTNLDIIALMAIATEKRNPDASEYFRGVVKMREE